MEILLSVVSEPFIALAIFGALACILETFF